MIEEAYADGGLMVDAATLHLMLLETDDPGGLAERMLAEGNNLADGRHSRKVRDGVFIRSHDLDDHGMPNAWIAGDHIMIPSEELPETMRAALPGRRLGDLVAAPDFLADRIIDGFSPPLPSLKGIPGWVESIGVHLVPMPVPLPPRRCVAPAS